MRGILIRLLVRNMAEEPEKYTKRVILAILIPFVGVILALLTLMYGLRPEALNGYLESAESSYDLIEAYDKWYGILTVTRVAGRVIVIVCCVAAVVIGRKSLAAVAGAVVISLFGLLMCDLMFLSENIPELREMAQEDMAQIEDDRLETVEVYLLEKTVREKLPGPYAEGQQESFIVYRGIGEATNHKWESFYIPEILGFTPDAGKLYNEKKSIDWNEENAQVYYITYTTNFRVVISIQPTAP